MPFDVELPADSQIAAVANYMASEGVDRNTAEIAVRNIFRSAIALTTEAFDTVQARSDFFYVTPHKEFGGLTAHEFLIAHPAEFNRLYPSVLP